MTSDFYVFGVVDGSGKLVQAVCSEPCDTILITGVFPETHPTLPGSPFHYEDDACHLIGWAVENFMN